MSHTKRLTMDPPDDRKNEQTAQMFKFRVERVGSEVVTTTARTQYTPSVVTVSTKGSNKRISVPIADLIKVMTLPPSQAAEKLKISVCSYQS
jgi:hypothetical protein